MNDDLTRSACRIFGHKWQRAAYRAFRTSDALRGAHALVIQRQRVCSRCGEVEVVKR